eukprot:TRINITY_DN775815_c0_g1_i1.p1 TRINITY_DN775815_c0_g1~~TRINITY_DN775815_c0_g1_i1.p1  ORF type:complete len:215 (+),score=40.69 TRINITY_DN775815_c0_g1_i1:233-877(+)
MVMTRNKKIKNKSNQTSSKPTRKRKRTRQFDDDDYLERRPKTKRLITKRTAVTIEEDNDSDVDFDCNCSMISLKSDFSNECLSPTPEVEMRIGDLKLVRRSDSSWHDASSVFTDSTVINDIANTSEEIYQSEPHFRTTKCSNCFTANGFEEYEEELDECDPYAPSKPIIGIVSSNQMLSFTSDGTPCLIQAPTNTAQHLHPRPKRLKNEWYMVR